MPRTRPASFTTLAILNLVFGGLFVICGLGGLSDTKMTFNGKDVSQEYKEHMANEVPAYRAYLIGSVVVTEALAIGYIVAGIGLLQVSAWGRRLALICAGVAIVYEIFQAIYTLTLVNPAIGKFMARGPIQLGGALSGLGTVVAVTVPVLSTVYNAVLIALLVGEKAARAVRGGYVPEEVEERPRRRPVRYEDEEEEEDRPRRRPRREEDEDESPPRRARRPEDIQDEPPRRKPPRPRPRNEDDE